MIDCLVARDAADHATPVHLVDPDTLDGVLKRLGEAAVAYARAAGFKAGAGALLLVPGEGGLSAALFGLGRKGGAERTPFLPGTLATALPSGTYRLEGELERPELAALAFALSGYRFDRYRKAEPKDVRLILPDGVDGAEVSRIAEGVRLARDLVNTPANDLGPAELAEAARTLAERHGASVSVTEGERLEAEFPMVHAVGRASARAPRLVDLVWGDAQAPKVTLVGKGVCFDSGGLDIKPSNAMALMKKDMGGAAAVLGLAHMVMDAGLPVRLRVLIPAVENMISGASFRTGDVLRSRKGLTVEIGNTDAEGRLILADALALADDEAPELLVDLATLTGAARVALGPDLPPFYTPDDRLAADLAIQAEASFDPLWRMPLWPAYDALLSSKIADVSHVSSAPMAGSITAALFLKRFIEKARAWVHFDVYAWNPKTLPGRPEGGEAQAIRALYALLKARYLS
ncbi:MAG: leucyl aminopeptidase family protein [Pseudomonadota bacterium]|nr:leucyl aminopeptidase family protein [Pseudomonadota bacterium]